MRRAVTAAVLGVHAVGDLVEGLGCGDGPVGGPDEEDEAEPSGGAAVSAGDQDAAEPAE